MAFNMEKAPARRLLGALEDGKLGATDTFHLVEETEPLYFLVELNLGNKSGDALGILKLCQDPKSRILGFLALGVVGWVNP